MFSTGELMVFSLACWALILSPGPDMLYVITRGISGGRLAGVLSAAGVISGTLVHTLFAACGLSIILKTSALVFMAVKVAGAAYLIYLGVQALLNKNLLSLQKGPQPGKAGPPLHPGNDVQSVEPQDRDFFPGLFAPVCGPAAIRCGPAHDRFGAALCLLRAGVPYSSGLFCRKGGGVAGSASRHQSEDQVYHRKCADRAGA
jgi:threonine/homoserine/homoserine lactone efflux protein